MNEGQLHKRGGDEGSEYQGAVEAAREAEQRELDASVLAAQVEQSLHAYRMTLGVAGQAIERVIGEAIAIAMLLTWSPGREEEIEMRIAAAAQNLAGFRGAMNEVSAARQVLAIGDQAFDPVQDQADHYSGTLDAFREVRRQIDGLISVLGSDMCNTPALTATARAVSEAEYIATIRARGLSIFLERIGLAA